MNTKTETKTETEAKTKAKADRSKEYVAAEDTIIEGRPVRKGIGVEIKGMSDEAFQSYVDAGLITEPEVTKEDKAAAKALEEGAKAIDKSEDTRTEK